jgi:hypothetical protein
MVSKRENCYNLAMKFSITVALVSFVLIGLCWTAAAQQKDQSEWYPFYFPAKMDPNSPANIGKLVLDPPAGKHGFVKVKDGHFYFEDGTRGKFWGTNLCFEANFPNKKQAEMLVDRMAFFGFNAVRLHHMDFFFEPQGIFKDISPAYKDPKLKKTGVLSEKQLDRLDYLIYLLKQRGIYVDMNLLVSRHFTQADGVEDAEKLAMAAKPVSMFDPKLIELQKQYAKDLLTHYNTCAKLRYCDDPTIALIEITNENSILNHWKTNTLNGSSSGNKKNAIPQNYTKQLDKLWNEWLRTKYGTDRNIKKAWFSGTRPSSAPNINVTNFQRPLYASLSSYPKQLRSDIEAFYAGLQGSYFEQMISFLRNDIGVNIPITGIGGYSHGGNFNEGDLISQESCDFIDIHSYWDHPRFPNPANRRAFELYNHSILGNRHLGILGYSLQRQRPLLIKTELSDTNSIFNNFYLGKVAQLTTSKPFTISEWNHCFPNPYAYETPPLLGATARKFSWDALFQFAFSHELQDTPTFDKIDEMDFFDIISNPQQLILSSIGALLFHNMHDGTVRVKNQMLYVNSKTIKGVAGQIKNQTFQFDQFDLTPLANGAVFIFSLDDKLINQAEQYILVAVGGVKNTNGGWDQGDIYQWGTSPTLLRMLPTNININDNRNYLAYSLDQEGREGKHIPITKHAATQQFSTSIMASPWFNIKVSPTDIYKVEDNKDKQ